MKLETITFTSIFIFLNLVYIGVVVEIIGIPLKRLKYHFGMLLTLWIAVPAFTFAFGILLMSNPRYVEWFG